MTLEELMARCDGPNGQRFRWLKNQKTYWLAQARPEHTTPAKPDVTAKGATPREAVENLLSLLTPSN